MKQKGVSLIELMITLVVLGIATAFAMPAFDYVIANNRQSAMINQLVGAMNLARLEAIKRGAQVSIATMDGSNNWHNGYRLWVDANSDIVFDSGEELVRQYDAATAGGLTGSAKGFGFRATGFSTAAGNVAICSNYKKVAGRQVSLALSGRVSTIDYSCP